MIPYTLAELIRGAQGALAAGRLDARVTGVSIDSRTTRPGDVFFAIRGHHQDGHAFLGEARARGAGAVVVRHLPADLVVPGDDPVVLVSDTTVALQRLGAFHRRRFAIPVVGITGSNGKTTTKELTAAVLATRLRVLKAAGSQNNQWGVPLTLLGLDPEHEAAVLEFGMNAFGEIAAHARLAQPTLGVVTTIAPAHLEGVGSIEGVQKAKGELVEAIPAGGMVILNADDPLVLALADRAQARVVTFGQSAAADVRLGDVSVTTGGVTATLKGTGGAVTVRLPLAARHNAWNAAAAVTVGLALGVSLEEAAQALERAAPLPGRLVWREVGGVHVLDDTYNANPTSLWAALDVLRGPGTGSAGEPSRLWAILGDMRELGLASDAAHREAGAWVAALPVAGLATVGPAMRRAAEVAQGDGCHEVASFDAPEGAAAFIAARIAPGDRVLVKGSRGLRMERALVSLVRALETREASRC